MNHRSQALRQSARDYRGVTIEFVHRNCHKSDGGCLLWTGYKTRAGYGQISRGDRDRVTFYVHRLAYEMAIGPIPDGLHVLHRCDRPACCNPHHLFVGTQADNNADKQAKGRQARGEAHGNARLTDADVLRIRQMRKAGDTYATIGKEFGIGRHNVSDICRGKAWRHG